MLLRRYILGCLFMSVCAASTAAEAGRVVFVTGDATLAGRAATLDNPVQEGDELKTGANGYIYMKTVDAGFLILRPNSHARVTAYHIDSAKPANTRVKFELLGGVARSISGQEVKKARQNFRFNTPVAAIGVRGTDFIVFADQQTARVTVMSGGVVVSPFGAGCGRDAGGPCEGNSSRELFAAQGGMLLQVRRGEAVPQLLRNPALSPDQSAPPRPDEPVGKVSGAASTTAPLAAEINLDASKGNLVQVATRVNSSGGGNGGTDGGAPPVTPPVTDPGVTVPPPVTPPVAVVAGPPEVFWGRWQTVAGEVSDSKDIGGFKDMSSKYYLGAYVIGRNNNASFVMPKDGTAAFVMSNSAASMQKTGQVETAALVQDGKLEVDFAARSFKTGLTVVSGEDRVKVSGAGDVTNLGVLINNNMSQSIIRGFLGGARAEEAGYLFQDTATPGIKVTGATKWSH